MLREAARLLALIDDEAVSEKTIRAVNADRRALRQTLLVLWLAMLAPARAAAQPRAEPRRLFQQAVAAYGRGDYRRAAELFRAVEAERPRDPYVLYNLGNAYYELEERGRAVAYWLRALRLRPRDEDARFNLRLVAGDDPVIGGALPPLPLSAEELAFLMTLLWVGGCTTLIVQRRTHRGYLNFTGGALILLAALCAAVLLRPRTDYAIVAERGAPLRSAPLDASEVITTTSPGTGYRVQERRGDWLRVARGATEGWIAGSAVELVP